MQARYSITQTSENVDLICKLAKEKNSKELKKILGELGVSINVVNGYYNDFLSPLYILAKENQRKAINFLIKHFNADPQIIIMGYAEGGHIDSVNDLLNQYEVRYQEELLFHAIQGYAYGGNTFQINNIIESELDAVKRDSYIESAILGLAASSRISMSRLYLELLTDKQKVMLMQLQIAILADDIDEMWIILNKQNSFDYDRKAVLCLTKKNNFTQAEKIFKRNEKNYLRLLQTTIFVYAGKNSFEKIENIISQVTDAQSKRSLKNMASMSFITNGYVRSGRTIINEETDLQNQFDYRASAILSTNDISLAMLLIDDETIPEKNMN